MAEPLLASAVSNASIGIKGRLFARFKQHSFLWIALLVGFFLRQHNLLLNAADWDEANVLSISMLPFKDMVWFTFTHDIHPPGFPLTLALWANLFGHSDLALRYFSLLWGVVSIAGGYLLAWEFSKSRKLSGLTALFMAFMPVAIRYSHFYTAPTLSCALVLFSWLFFLKTIKLPEERSIIKSFSFWAYVLISFWGTQQYASGPFFLIFQGLCFLLMLKQIAARHRTTILWAGLGLLAVNIPHMLVISQSWHPSKASEIQGLHSAPDLIFFLLTPLSLLFYNFDWRFDTNDTMLVPPWGQLVLYLLLVYGLLAYGFRYIAKSAKTTLMPLLLIGPIPLFTAYLLGYFGFSFFNFRSLLFTAFPLYYGLAYLAYQLYTQQRKALAALLTAILLAMQCFLPIPLQKFTSMDWRVAGQRLRDMVQPGDGIIVYPGMLALPLLHYYKFSDFGITRQQLEADPRRGDNFFNEVIRIDDRYFLINGDEVAMRPEVRQAFMDFQKKHRRLLWIFGTTKVPLLQYADCQKEMWMVGSEGNRQMSCMKP